MKGSVDIVEKVVTLTFTCADHYEALMLYDKLVEGVRSGSVTLTMGTANSHPERVEDDPPDEH
jgi:hypothetical protein